MCVQSLSQEDPRRRAWQPIPIFLPGKSHGQKSLAGYTTEYSTAQPTELISLIHTSCGFFIVCIPASFPAALLPYDSREK